MLRVGPCRQRFPRLHVQLFGKKDTARPHCILRTRRVCGVPDLTSSVGSGQWAPSGSWKDGRVTGNVRQGPAPTCRTTAFRGYGTVQGRVRKPPTPIATDRAGKRGSRSRSSSRAVALAPPFWRRQRPTGSNSNIPWRCCCSTAAPRMLVTPRDT